MSKKEFIEYLCSLTSHITFEYNGKDCGVDPFGRDN